MARPRERSPPTGVKTTCQSPDVALVPCPQSVRLAVPFATSSITNGRHTLQVAAEDAAGNRRVSGGWTRCYRQRRRGKRQPRVACRAAPRKFRSARGEEKAEGDEPCVWEPARVSGKLVDGSGQPIGAARIDIVARPGRAGADWRKEGEVATLLDGSFRRLMRLGPSRDCGFSTARSRSTPADFDGRTEDERPCRRSTPRAAEANDEPRVDPLPRTPPRSLRSRGTPSHALRRRSCWPTPCARRGCPHRQPRTV